MAYLTKHNIANGVLSYCRKKTIQPLITKQLPKKNEIIRRYTKSCTGDYLLPILSETDIRKSWLHYIRMRSARWTCSWRNWGKPCTCLSNWQCMSHGTHGLLPHTRRKCQSQLLVKASDMIRRKRQCGVPSFNRQFRVWQGERPRFRILGVEIVLERAKWIFPLYQKNIRLTALTVIQYVRKSAEGVNGIIWRVHKDKIET